MLRSRGTFRLGGAACLVLALLLVGSPAATAQERFDQNGVIFVHGFVGTGAQFESQKLRFMSNGYPESWIEAIDYDSTFATESRSDVHARIDRLVAEMKQRTGRPKVDILGHSLGTSVMQEYLNSSAERAANIAHYVNVDGRTADAPPGGVPTLAVWAGRGRPDRQIAGATNVTVPNQTHVEVATSRESFVEYHKFFTGKAPAHDIVPQSGEVTIEGRVLHFPVNRGVAGATLEVWEVAPESGRRTGDAPVTRVAIGESGDWGPVKVVAGRHHEFVVIRPGVQTHHHYYEPFVRSDHLVRLLESDLLTQLGDRGNHVAGVVLRYKELWGDQEGQNDVLAINGTNVCVPALCPISKQVNAMFFFDRGSDGRTDLSSPDPRFSSLPFVAAADVFVPAAIPPAGKATVELRSRGGGPPRAVNFPNFSSLTDTVTVQLNDFDRVDAPCRRGSRIRFRLNRTRGRITRVEAFVNRRRAARRSGRNIKSVTLTRLPQDGRMTVRIVTTHATRAKLISTRTWNGCAKTKPRMRSVRPR